MRTVAIIQARLGSQRLPNKVLLPLPPGSVITALERVVKAASGAELIDEVVLDMPFSDGNSENYKINSLCEAPVFWGSDNRDLLKDYYVIANCKHADVIVRLTADCPMLTPEIIDNCVKKFLDAGVDFVYNTSPDDQPYRDGFDVEVFSREALERAYKESQEERQHVTVKFRKGDYTRVRAESPEGEFYSLDTQEDYQKICRIFENG